MLKVHGSTKPFFSLASIILDFGRCNRAFAENKTNFISLKFCTFIKLLVKYSSCLLLWIFSIRLLACPVPIFCTAEYVFRVGSGI